MAGIEEAQAGQAGTRRGSPTLPLGAGAAGHSRRHRAGLLATRAGGRHEATGRRLHPAHNDGHNSDHLLYCRHRDRNLRQVGRVGGMALRYFDPRNLVWLRSSSRRTGVDSLLTGKTQD
jgi:hypothetical protein